jgi:sulfur carrier protein
MTKTLEVNGEARSSAAATLAELLAELGIDPATRWLAVARNGAVALRREWPATPIDAGDRIEIIRPRQGG